MIQLLVPVFQKKQFFLYLLLGKNNFQENIFVLEHSFSRNLQAFFY